MDDQETTVTLAHASRVNKPLTRGNPLYNGQFLMVPMKDVACQLTYLSSLHCRYVDIFASKQEEFDEILTLQLPVPNYAFHDPSPAESISDLLPCSMGHCLVKDEPGWTTIAGSQH